SIHANAAPKKKYRRGFKGIEVYYLSPAKTQRAKEAAAKENSVMFENKDYYTKNAYLSLLSREKIVESHKLGIDVSNKMIQNVRRHYGPVEDGGVKTANFWVLVGAQMPAILVETGYITHPKEGKNLMKSYYQSLLAQGIAEGIELYLKNK
ncbi:MAG TPA: N-acetylmuramoyl-L-alanine amidase, partial [Campylobacterales bacterium]|nr:N-acetylmuramoyl-L-alanine amidase [Campylobacterales bacterium]